MGRPNEKVKDFEEDDKLLLRSFNDNAKNPREYFNEKSPKESFKKQNNHPGENRSLAIPNNLSGDLEELEERVKSMMEKSPNKTASGRQFAHVCKVCGKEGEASALKDHIEVNHLEGINIPCNLCDKTFRSRNGFRQHKRLHQN